MDEDKAHVWRVGELCTTSYDTSYDGFIYRVLDVARRHASRVTVGGMVMIDEVLEIEAVFSFTMPMPKRTKRTLNAVYCSPIGLLELGPDEPDVGTVHP